MNKYYHRSEDGFLRNKISNDIALRIFQEVKGSFQKKNLKELGEKLCYTITEDRIYTSQFGKSSIEIFLWAGDYFYN